LRERKHTGGCVVHRYDSWDLWKACFLRDGLIEGAYLQNGGIESDTLRAEYHLGRLHGYRVVYSSDSLDVMRFRMGVLQCRYRQNFDGRVLIFNSQQTQYLSKRLCLHCIANHCKNRWLNQKRMEQVRMQTIPLLPAGVVRIVARYLYLCGFRINEFSATTDSVHGSLKKKIRDIELFIL
jgi:hypothetical protein